MRNIILLAALTGFANPATSFDQTELQLNGAAFLDACTRPNESWISFCNGYIQATIDTLLPRDEICFPAGTTRTDIVELATIRIAANQALQPDNAQDALRAILWEHFPC